MEYKDTQLAYLSGIIDGEGTISICDKRIKKRSDKGLRNYAFEYRARVNFSCSVTVCNTNHHLMDWLINNFGGNISYSKRQKSNWAMKATWIMKTTEISSILKLCLPYLVLKKEQAILMIEARKSFDENPKALAISDEIYNRRLEIAKLIRFHNQNLPPCCPSL